MCDDGMSKGSEVVSVIFREEEEGVVVVGCAVVLTGELAAPIYIYIYIYIYTHTHVERTIRRRGLCTARQRC